MSPALKAGSRAARRRAGARWTHERIIRAMQLILDAQGELTLAELAARLGVSPRRIVELTHWVLGPDPALGLQGAEFTPVFAHGVGGMRVQAGVGLGRALRTLSLIGANEAGLALAALRRLQGQGPAARRERLRILGDRLARAGAAEADGQDGALAQPLPILDLRAILEDAIAQQRQLRFEYRGPKGWSQRHVRPRYVFCWAEGGDELYLEAWEEGPRGGPRHFRLSQILRSSVVLGPAVRPFNAEESAAFEGGRMESGFEASFDPVLVLATGSAASRLAQGELRARPWSGAPARPPRGWQAFELRYKEPQALVRALRPLIPEVRVAGPPAFEQAWRLEIAALKRVWS